MEIKAIITNPVEYSVESLKFRCFFEISDSTNILEVEIHKNKPEV